MRFTVVFSGLGMSAADPVKIWKRISMQNPVRHQSVGYYARISANGKETWKCLATDLLEVAKVKLREISGTVGKTVHAGHAGQRGNMTMEDCAVIFSKRIEDGFGLRGRGTIRRRIGDLPSFVVMTDPRGVSGHALPQRRLTAARSRHARRHERPHAMRESRRFKKAQRGAPPPAP